MAIEILNQRSGGFTGRELKFVDSERTALALAGTWANIVPSTGVTNCISCPAQGNGEQQRIGRKYTIKSVHLRFRIAQNGSESQTAPIPAFNVRVIVYWDRQTNSTEPNAGDIMNTTGASDILAFRNLQTTTRFIVLMDKVIHFEQFGQVAEGASNLFAIGDRIKLFKFNKKITIPVLCDGTTADVASVTDNSLGVQAIVDTVTPSAPTIAYQARVRFVG